MPMPKIVIIGQGLAGSFLSMRLREKGVDHRVVDDPRPSQSSRIAAGIANPIVLKRLKWVRYADAYLEHLLPFYKRWEEPGKGDFFRPFGLMHRFSEVAEVNRWLGAAAEEPYARYLQDPVFEVPEAISAPHGLGPVQGLYWLDTAAFLAHYRHRLESEGILEERKLTELRPAGEDEILVYCQGHLGASLHPALEKFYQPSRGEVMTITAPDLPEEYAWHGRIFALPLGEHRFKVGATYQHDYFSDHPSAAGQSFLRKHLETLYRGPYRVEHYEAGVRPNTRDRQALLGSIGPGQYLFSGFGSRGVLMGPYLAKLMAEHLVENRPIPPQWSVERAFT